MESSQWKNWNNLLCRKFSFLSAPHCPFWSVGQGMKQTYLYLWYPLFQAQWKKLRNQGFLLLSWRHHFESFTVTTMTWLTVNYEVYVSQITTDMFHLS
jgi:hypothetical protein